MQQKLNDIVSIITTSDDYLECIRLKKQLSNNLELMRLIADIKKLQKQCVRYPEDEQLKKQLASQNEKLDKIPLYMVYMNHLEQVNIMISYVADELNDYFFQVLNQFSL